MMVASNANQETKLLTLKASKFNSGFAGAVFLVIILISLLLAALAYMQRGNMTGSNDQAAKMNASIILKQSSDFKIAFDRELISTGISESEVTFDNNINGIFNTDKDKQYAVLHLPPKPAFVFDSGVSQNKYTYTKSVFLPSVGDQNRADYAVTAGNLTSQLCQTINRILYQDSVFSSPAISAGSLAAWTTAEAAVDDRNKDSTSNYSGRTEGCIQTSDGKYVYYKVMVER